jgi:adenine-specific DNA-methyltransferase
MNSFFSEGNIENEDITIQHGDVLEKCRNLSEEKFKLIVTSPPYNLGKEYEDKVDLEQYLIWQKKVIAELVRVCAKEGSIVWQVGNYVKEGEIFPLDIYFYPIFKQLGMQLRNRIIWHFEHGLHASKRFSGRYETLLWFTKTDQYTFNLDNVRVPSKYPGKLHYKGNKKGQPSGNPLGKNPSDFWNIICNEWKNGIIEIPNVKANHPEKTIHPCQFPVELIERCVLALTNENDWILDPFGGVGSTLIAALKHQRKATIIDINENYLNIAKERVQALLEGSLKLRPLGKAIHQPSGNEKVSQIPKEWFKSEQDILL